MSTGVFLAVLLAALLHATWNAVVKGGADKHLAMTAVVVGQAVFGLPVLLFVPSPDPASFGWLAVGIALHTGYQLVLLASYRIGDLTQVYPIARGSAPLIVAAISVLFLGVMLSGIQLVAVAVIGVGIMSLALVRRADGQRNPKAGLLALTTGCFIAAYSLIDGLGAREAGTALGFYGWLTLGNAFAFVAIASVRHRPMLKRVPTQGWRIVILGGGASYAAYALVIWSFTQAPIALVTALRETSVVFALLIGVFALGEQLNLMKVFSTACTILGAGLLRFARP
ncbi:DMT family transporter [Rhizobiaceae bacterium]|nr:DMT family transporter [Rhizobiaceae bacterium]